MTRSFCRLSGRPLYAFLERGRACTKVALEDLHVGVGLVVAQLGHKLGGLPVGDARVMQPCAGLYLGYRLRSIACRPAQHRMALKSAPAAQTTIASEVAADGLFTHGSVARCHKNAVQDRSRAGPWLLCGTSPMRMQHGAAQRSVWC